MGIQITWKLGGGINPPSMDAPGFVGYVGAHPARKVVLMDEHDAAVHERLLREWAFRREVVNCYCGALRLLNPDDPGAHQRWRALSGQLAAAMQALSEASARLRSYEQEQALRRLLAY